jgi:hypothetical protein
MRTLLLPGLVMTLLFSCSSEEDKKHEEITLAFNPENGKAVRIHHTFSVNSLSNGDLSTFEMSLSGKANKQENGNILLELRNDSIKMNGTIQGGTVSGSAGGTDTMEGNASLVAMPVFAFKGKTFRSELSPQFDKRSEVQVENGTILDSAENKMQIYLRYPNHPVKAGDTWNKELLIKSGNKMNCSAIYTLKEIMGDTALISVEGKLNGTGESFGNEFTIEGNLKGSFVVHVASGWPLRTELNQDFVLKMAGKELPMKYNIVTRIE